jgi:hypothetical protein
MTIQDLGSIGELVGGIAVVVSLIYLGIQIRHNTRGLEQNADLMRLSFEESIRREAIEFRSTIAQQASLSSIWRRGLGAEPDLDAAERVQFELLMANVVAILRAQFDAERRGLTSSQRGVYFKAVAAMPGFRRWWDRRGIRDDSDFGAYLAALSADPPATEERTSPGSSAP